MLKKCGLGFIAFSPLAQGLLTDRYLHGIPADSRVHREGAFLHESDITDQWIAKATRLNDIAAGRGQSLAQMSISWLLAKRYLTSVITGVSSTHQLDNSLKAIDAPPFTADELTAIDAILQ